MMSFLRHGTWFSRLELPLLWTKMAALNLSSFIRDLQLMHRASQCPTVPGAGTDTGRCTGSVPGMYEYGNS